MSFLFIRKPSGITSHDVVDYIRHITGQRRVGHAGTLDPFADGLLIVAVGRESTKQLGMFMKMDKHYRATLRFGATSDTYDRTGVITQTRGQRQPSLKKIETILTRFTGAIAQIPPMYSAKKINGKKLYELARRGIEVTRKPVTVTIHSLSVIAYSYPLMTLDAHCSSGTYVRSLAHDIGQVLGLGAYLEKLTRTAIGPHSLRNAAPLVELTRENWRTCLK